MDDTRRADAARRARQIEERKQKQRKAIAGNHPIEKRAGFLMVIMGDLQKVMPEAIDDRYETYYLDIFNLRGFANEEEIQDAEQYIAACVQNWMEHVTDDKLKVKVFRLKEQTRRYLARNIPGWPEFIRGVRKVRNPLPDDLKRYIKGLLADRATYKLSDIGEYGEYGEYTVNRQDAFRLVFTESEDYGQDHRIRKVRKTLLKELKDELQSPSVEEWLNIEWPEKKADPWPTEWMKRDKQLMRNLNRKGCQHFFPLINFLFQKSGYMGTKEGARLASERGWRSGLVMIEPDYARIEAKLGVPLQIARKYLKEMARCGMVGKLGKTGERGNMVYSIGEWVQGRNAFPRPVLFLKNTKEMREALRGFDPYRSEKSQK